MKTSSVGLAWLAVGIILGAFGSHLLKARLLPETLEIWKTGTNYHFVAALALILFGVLRLRKPIVLLFGIGSVIFSGSLYLLCLTGQRFWGAVTPIGGVLMITSLIVGSIQCWKNNVTPRDN